MSLKPIYLTRRNFSASMIASVVAPIHSMSLTTGRKRPKSEEFAIVGAGTDAFGALHVFRLGHKNLEPIQTIASQSPAHVFAHPSGDVFYAVHEIDTWENLPRGAISAYSIASQTGQITHHRTQPLSLSAISPRHAVATPDGRCLIVAATVGGIYNLLPLDANHLPLPPAHIYKEVGDGAARISSPVHVIPHGDGSAFAIADSGNGAVSTFSLENDRIGPMHRRRVHQNSGPAQIALSVDEKFLYTLNAKDGSVSVHSWNDGKIKPAHQRIATDGAVSLAMHPGGRYLLTANGNAITTWQIDRSSGRLTLEATSPIAATQMRFYCEGQALLAIDTHKGALLRAAFDADRGRAILSDETAVPLARSLLVL